MFSKIDWTHIELGWYKVSHLEQGFVLEDLCDPFQTYDFLFYELKEEQKLYNIPYCAIMIHPLLLIEFQLLSALYLIIFAYL